MTTQRLFIAYLAVVLVFGVGVEETFAIMGGKKALPGEMPYQVLIRGGKGICGGAIISKRHILTSATCVQGTDPQILKVRTGMIELFKGGQTYFVENVEIHKDYNNDPQGSYEHDIAIIKVTKDIAENEFQKPIALATDDTPNTRDAVLGGFGKLYPKSRLSSWLMKIETYILSNGDCQRRIDNTVNPKIRISQNHICTSKGAVSGVCTGDSGDPVVADGQLIGIAATPVPCNPAMPDVLTKVYAHLDWIKKHMI